MNTETKTISYTSAATLTNTAAAITNCFINPIAQGVTDSTREGSTVRLTRYRIRCAVTAGAANLLPNCAVRLILVAFSKYPGNAPNNATTSVLKNGGVSGFPELLSGYTNSDDKLIKNQILWDQSFSVGVTGTFPTVQFAEFEWHPTEFHLEWTSADTAGTFTNSTGRSLVLFALASTATASNFPVVNFDQEIDYVDN